MPWFIEKIGAKTVFSSKDEGTQAYRLLKYKSIILEAITMIVYKHEWIFLHM